MQQNRESRERFAARVLHQPKDATTMRYDMRMRSVLLALWLGVLLFGGVVPPSGWCQYEVEQEQPFWLRGLLDLRVAQGGRAHAWTDRGPGKTRYGGRSTAQSPEQVTRLAFSQLAIEGGVVLPWDIVAKAQLNWEPDSYREGHPSLIEAYFRKEWGEWEKGWGLQTGVLSPPFSLEHTGPAWTPLYTLTPSALSTWLWEEFRIAGVEGEWWRTTPGGLRLSLLAGAGFGADSFGWLLPERGWVLSDALSGINDVLSLPRPGVESFVFDERDNRPAIYAQLTLSDPQQRGEVKLGYLDNLGDQNTTGAWATRFGTLGAILHPLARLDFLLQYLIGETHTHVATWDSSFTAFYALLSYHYHGHRFSARYDVFRVHDLDGGPRWSRDRGDAATLAYLFEFGLHHRVGFEYIFAHSRHPSLSHSDPSDGGWQLSYRFRY